jgi:hypothetical protein
MAALLFLATSVSVGAPVAMAPTCRVLSISGGGSFGAFEIGVLSRLVEQTPGLDYDYMLGVSAGALNAGTLSTFPVGADGFKSGVDFLKTTWEGLTNGDVYKMRLDPFSDPPSILSTAPLQAMIDKTLKGRMVQRNVTIGTTNLATGASAKHDERELAANTNTILRASSAIPLVFPPIELNGTRHVDGGNSANVLTVHGIERCDAAAAAAGLPPPNIELEVILAESTISQASPSDVSSWGFFELASREWSIARKEMADHELRFKCPPGGPPSRIRATLHSPIGEIEPGATAMLDFDKGAEVWGVGYNVSRVATTSFDFCI